VKVATPLGSFPFEFRRIERRDGGLAITGTVAGLQSSVVFEAADLRLGAKLLGPPVALLGLVAWFRCRS
jgi:hypothetical protein